MSVMRADLVEETALPRSFPELIELCDGEDRILHLEDVTDSLERIPGFILGRLLDHEPSPVISSKLDKRVHRKWLHCQELSNDRQLRTPRFELLCWGIMADNAEEILLHAGDVLAIRAPRVTCFYQHLFFFVNLDL